MENVEKLKTAVTDITIYLGLVSGTSDYQLKKCGYYCVSTHYIHKFDKFPPLIPYGETGSGKTSLMDGMEPFCFNPVKINVSQTTKASVREDFQKASPGTVLVEESEESTENPEITAYLQNRYARSTGKASKMVPAGTRSWQKQGYDTFGASVIHRRDHFQDPAMENRAIWLELQRNDDRPKKSYLDKIPEELVDPVLELIKEAGDINLPEPDVPDHLPGRVIDTYRPIIIFAQALDDKPFLRELMNELDIAAAAFRDGQSYSPKVLVFKALLGCLTRGETLYLDRSIFVEKDICKFLQNNYMQGMRPRNAVKYLRELGLKDKEHLILSSGVTKVTSLTIPLLAKISKQLGVVDETLANAARESTPPKSRLTREDFQGDTGD